MVVEVQVSLFNLSLFITCIYLSNSPRTLFIVFDRQLGIVGLNEFKISIVTSDYSYNIIRWSSCNIS